MFRKCMRFRWAPTPLEGLAKNAPVAQLDRALDYESRGQEFESLRARHEIKYLAPACFRSFRFRKHIGSVAVTNDNQFNNERVSGEALRPPKAKVTRSNRVGYAGIDDL